MIPTSSSGTTNGCDNISSNCVIWQGPDITCIDLCAGDTISEVSAKIANKVCQIITDGVTSNPDLTGLDLSCLQIPGQDPTEIVPVLQAMVDQICANSGAGGGTATPLPIVTLPSCLVHTDSSGNPVTELRLDLYAAYVADQVCSNLSAIQAIQTTLTSYNNRLLVLENCVLDASGNCNITVPEVQIIPTCVGTVGSAQNVSQVVTALELAFCALRDAVGLPGAISQAISLTVLSGVSTTLTDSSVSYGSITGWSNSPSTLAQSVGNAWLVIDDIYAALASVQTNCCPVGCDAVTFNFTTATTIGSSGLIDGVVFNFTGSIVPPAFNDTTGFSLITLTDSNGQVITQQFSVASLQNQTSGLLVGLPSPFNTAEDIQVQVQFSVSDGVDTCQASQSAVINGIIPCPAMTITSITTSGFTVNWNNALGTSVQYILDILDPNNLVAATYTINNPTTSISRVVTGLNSNVNYQARLTVNIGSATEVCANTVFAQTDNNNAPCSDGMDVALILDYTFSMQGEISAIKNDIATITTAIDTNSGTNDYRIGVVTVDEYADTANTIPTYEGCADYDPGLPSAQRIINTGTSQNKIVITAWEMFNTNNAAAVATQVGKLDGGVDGTCINIGSGNGLPEPTDVAIQQVVNSAFLGAFRSNVAKYLVVVTDEAPSGGDDAFDATDWAVIQQLITTCNNDSIKVFVCGAGTNNNLTQGS